MVLLIFRICDGTVGTRGDSYKDHIRSKKHRDRIATAIDGYSSEKRMKYVIPFSLCNT